MNPLTAQLVTNMSAEKAVGSIQLAARQFRVTVANMFMIRVYCRQLRQGKPWWNRLYSDVEALIYLSLDRPWSCRDGKLCIYTSGRPIDTYLYFNVMVGSEATNGYSECVKDGVASWKNIHDMERNWILI